MTDSDLRELVPGLVNASCPLPDVLAGGQPSPQHVESLARGGIRTVLDTRGTGEPRGFDEPAAVRAAGMEYVALPVGHGGIPDETFDRFRELMGDPGRRPVLVHCASGNRVGALMLPYLLLDEGREPEEALELAVGCGLRSRELADVAFDYARRHGAAGE
ncbi:MAG TPA: protein tyrosine phosphatase family protein [Longimicrobiales bacterium]|nr:protein tyrosine phosphatase family protein [Longimicrobiales bacterium]